MRIRVVVPAANIDDLRERLLDGVDKLEHEESGEEWSGVGKLHHSSSTPTHFFRRRC